MIFKVTLLKKTNDHFNTRWFTYKVITRADNAIEFTEINGGKVIISPSLPYVIEEVNEYNGY